jgi:hypothetical protein
MATNLVGVFELPRALVLYRMIPGSAAVLNPDLPQSNNSSMTVALFLKSCKK